MKVEVKQVLNDIDYMSEIIGKICFSTNVPNRWIYDMPRIDYWHAGTVRMKIINADVKDAIKILERYGVKAEAQGSYSNEISFECNASSDVIGIIAQAMSVRDMRAKSSMLDTLSTEVQRVSKQVPGVQSSLFSRGVDNLRNSVDALNAIVISQQKTLQK